MTRQESGHRPAAGLWPERRLFWRSPTGSFLAATADVAVPVADKHHRIRTEALIVLPSSDPEKFRSLHSLCEKRNAPIKSGFAVVTMPNAVAIAAAVFLNSPALVSVTITTPGAATRYHRASRLLQQAAG